MIGSVAGSMGSYTTAATDAAALGGGDERTAGRGRLFSGEDGGFRFFYSYTYPQPPAIRDQPGNPASAYFDTGLGEFVLSYDHVRRADDPRQAILDFAQTTYEAGARLQCWPRDVLEWTPPKPPNHRRAMPTT
jgi:hypothetical protein